MGRLDGKVALVTGAGRERGIGQGTAIELAREGADVVVTDLARAGGITMLGHETTAADTAGLASTVAAIEEMGAKALALPVDVTRYEEIEGAIETAVAQLGRLDVVVNNAGTPVGAQPFADLTDEHWQLSWDVNVMGAVHVIRAALPVFRSQGGGVVVNVASMMGVVAATDFSAYCATKFGVVGLTKALAIELGPDNVRVNAVCPGDIDTQMGDIGMEIVASTTGESSSDQGHPIALGRRGNAGDVGRLIAFLASDDSDYISGAAIRIDGAAEFGI